MKKLTVILVLVAASAIWFSTKRPPSPYCEKQSRFLSDEEFIYAAIKDADQRESFPLGTLKTYYEKNRECCTVDRNSFIDGRFFSGTDLTVRATVPDMNNRFGKGKDKFYEIEMHVTACGDPLYHMAEPK